MLVAVEVPVDVVLGVDGGFGSDGFESVGFLASVASAEGFVASAVSCGFSLRPNRGRRPRRSDCPSPGSCGAVACEVPFSVAGASAEGFS